MIDPIPVEEELQRIKAEQAALVRRGNGALALGWFSAYALSSGGGVRAVVNGVLPDQLKPIAYATPHAEQAIPYIERAFREYHRSIIKRAIELAEADFDPNGGA